MNQKLWVFEVFRRNSGRAGMCWSQLARVDHMRKKWRVGGKKKEKKKEQSLTGPRPAGPSPIRLCSFLFEFFLFFKFFFGNLENGLGFLGEWMYNTLIF
jgi:hypothetical protein